MIKIRDLVKSFDTKDRVLDCVDLNVEKGSIYGLVGVNGSGKTTLIKHIMGILKPDSGSIKIMGEEIYENTAIKQKMAYVPDELFFYHGFSLKDMSKQYASFYKGWSWEKYDSLVSSFGLNEKESLRSFSKGMQKQAYFILAVSTMPEILILDEPNDGLDPIVRKRVWSIIVDEVADRQMTVLVSSHNLREMEGVCDAIGIMKNGRVQIERDIDTLKTDIHKVQVAFTSEVYDPFKGLNVIHEDSRGSVKLIIAKNSFEEIEDIIGRNNPAVFDVLPLTLEEIFIYELGGGKDEQIFV